MSITQSWHENLESGGSTLCVFLDLAKAFDSVPHYGVIDALSGAGMLTWFRDYLSNRSQYVAVQGSSSPPSIVTSGVPQGSILDPLLFILSFDGIFHLPLSHERLLTGYADDVTCSWRISKDEDVSAAASDLDTICEWVKEHGFRLNMDKVKAMIISRKKKPPRPNLCLRGESIEFVDSFRLLGVTITSELTWRTHICETISKSKRLLGFLYRVFREGGQKCLSRLYKSVVLPHLDYCSSVWDPPHKSHIKRLEGVQSFAARIASNKWSSDEADLKSILKWPRLKERHLFQKICLCKRILDGSSIIEPSFFQHHSRPSSSLTRTPSHFSATM